VARDKVKQQEMVIYDMTDELRIPRLQDTEQVKKVAALFRETHEQLHLKVAHTTARMHEHARGAGAPPDGAV